MNIRKQIENLEERKGLLALTLAGFLSFITFLFYYPSLRYGFVFDDLPTITEYFYVRVFDPIGQFFSNSRWISRLLNQITYKYWQTDPFGYRIIDLGLHISIGLMIFFTLITIFQRMNKAGILSKNPYLVATMISGLFLLHPAQTQTATYITQMRLEGLVVFFTFTVITAFTYAFYARNRYLKISLYALSVILMLFAAGTKEIVIVAPILVLLFDWFLLSQGHWPTFKKHLIVHALLMVSMFGLMKKFGYAPTPRTISSMATTELRNNRGNTLTSTSTEKITPKYFIASQFKVILHYLWIFICPTHLSFDYDTKLSTHPFAVDVIIPLLILLMLFAYCMHRLRSNIADPIVFGFAWFFAALLPRASIFPATELICDYKTFLPSFGIMVVLGILLSEALVMLWQKISVIAQERLYQHATVGLLFVALGCATASRNVVWTSELTFWKDVITKAPNKSRAYNNYAVALWENGFAQESIDNYKKALSVDGSYGEPHVNLATIYQGMGRKEEALEHYKAALDTGEVHPELYHNLGVLHMSDQNWQTAEMCFREALAVRSYYSRSWIQLGKVYQVQNKNEQALQCYEQARKGDRGDDQELLYLHGSLSFQMNNIYAALESFKKLNPRSLDVAFQIGCCYYALNRYAQAAEYFEQACKQEPHNRSFAYNHAMALLNIGKYDQALNTYSLCEADKEQLPFIDLHKAHCLYKLGKTKEAKHQLTALIKTTKSVDVKTEAQHFIREHGLA